MYIVRLLEDCRHIRNRLMPFDKQYQHNVFVYIVKRVQKCLCESLSCRNITCIHSFLHVEHYNQTACAYFHSGAASIVWTCATKLMEQTFIQSSFPQIMLPEIEKEISNLSDSPSKAELTVFNANLKTMVKGKCIPLCILIIETYVKRDS